MKIKNRTRLIGFSTGSLHHTYKRKRTLKKTIEICQSMKCNAIELHCSAEKLYLLETLKKKDLKGFKFVSFHMPDISNNSDEEIFRILKEISKIHNKLEFNAMTFHPSEMRHYLSILKSFKLPVSLENEDCRKKVGKSLESMKKFLSDNTFKMTMDINHCFTNDPTLKLAHNLWKNFKKRIDHFHLSGYENNNSRWRHVSLFLTKQNQLIDFVADKNLPIIIEGVCQSLKEARKEINFIKDRLRI
jgi:sugar phosphate isomerase/epimerase